MKLTIYCAPWQLNKVPCSNEPESGATRSTNRWLPAKMLLIMKLTAFLLLVISLHVSARGVAQKITIIKKNATLEQIFELIQQQGGYDFLVSSQVLAKAHRVDVRRRDAIVADHHIRRLDDDRAGDVLALHHRPAGGDRDGAGWGQRRAVGPGVGRIREAARMRTGDTIGVPGDRATTPS